MTSNSLNQNWPFLVSGEHVIVSAFNPFDSVCRLYAQETTCASGSNTKIFIDDLLIQM